MALISTMTSPFYQEVQTITAIQLNLSIDQRKRLLLLNSQAIFHKGRACLVSGLQ